MSEQFRPQPDQSQPRRDAGDSLRGLPERQPDQTPQAGGSKSAERQPRPRIVFNPRKETFEEYKKRYDLTYEQREIEQAERRKEESDEQREERRKRNREYKRRWRQGRKQQRGAE